MIYTNKENNNYLMINKNDLYLILGTDIKNELYDEVISIIRTIKTYSKNHNYMSVKEIAISKDNIVAQYLINNNKIINNDLEVNLLKISNALSIAIFENNPITKKIIPLFKNQVCGSKDKLVKEYEEDIINYILNNDDFEYYLQNIDGSYLPKFYVVYENGECRERKLEKKDGVTLIKKI